MPSSRRLIASNTLTSSAASVTFSSIPGTYTDLVLKLSMRHDSAVVRNTFVFQPNGASSGISRTYVYGLSGSAASARSTTTQALVDSNGTSSTSNTFSSVEIYIPNYAGSANKPYSSFGVSETNAANGVIISADAVLYSSSSAITSIVISGSGGDFLTGSSFFLYGLSNT